MMAKQCNDFFIYSPERNERMFHSSPVAINAIIQRPSAYLTPVELDVGETFLQVPVVHQFELHPINELPTHFRWGEVKFLSIYE